MARENVLARRMASTRSHAVTFGGTLFVDLRLRVVNRDRHKREGDGSWVAPQIQFLASPIRPREKKRKQPVKQPALKSCKTKAWLSGRKARVKSSPVMRNRRLRTQPTRLPMPRTKNSELSGRREIDHAARNYPAHHLNFATPWRTSDLAI